MQSSESHLRSLLRSESSPGALLASERKKIAQITDEFTRTLKGVVRTEEGKTALWKGEGNDPKAVILSRGDSFAKHVLGQIQRSNDNKRRETADLQQRVDAALRKLEDFRVAECARLQDRVTALQDRYQTRIARIERRVAKEVEKLKTNLHLEIQREEDESCQRVRSTAEQLAASVAPETKQSVLAKVFGSQHSLRAAPLDYHAAERKRQSLQAMQRLNESRIKVMQLNRSESYQSSSERSDMRIEDLEDFDN